VILSLLFAIWAAAAPPPSLPDLIRALPNQKLSLDFILERAVKSSSSFAALEAGSLQAEATALNSAAAYDWNLFAGYNFLDSEAEATSSFNPTGTKVKGWNMGVRKQLPTGTGLEAKYSSNYNQILFANPAFRVPDYYENFFSISASQDLWANFLGSASRAEARALDKRSAAETLGFEESQDQWTLGIIEQYHQAWLAQMRLRSAEESLARRRELLKVTRLKSERGTAEKPDVLQVQSALLLAENAAQEASRDLDTIWRSLVVMLKLPESWLAIPPAKIPLELSAPPGEAADLCRARVAPAETRSVRRAELGLEAAAASLAGAQSRERPRLLVNGSYESNGIDGLNAESRREALASKHPAWKMGVQLEVPLGFSSQRSQTLQARAAYAQALGQKEAALDEATVNLVQNCQNLNLAKATLAATVEAAERQRERIRLEERRFQVGRSTTFQVIQASDDHANTDLARNQSEVALRQRAWAVVKTAAGLKNYLDRWSQ
jgi:outer membrane protein